MTTITNREALLAFSAFGEIGPKTMARLEKFFLTAANAFKAQSFYLEKAGLLPEITKDFISWREQFKVASQLSLLATKQINFITWHDKDYPLALKEIADPPFILYYRGNLKLINSSYQKNLAVVGAREPSPYGLLVSKHLLPKTIKAGCQIVSGLALGLDALAHQICLENQGKTIAVLGSGLNDESLYPPANYSLAHMIIKNGGLLISEYPPLTPPRKTNFPRRNRIISGISRAVLIIEAAEKSGSLITAEHALDQNREILTIPGEIFSQKSAGTNKLISLGATIITKPEDILEVFGLMECA